MKQSATIIFSSDKKVSNDLIVQIMRQLSAQIQNNGLRFTVLASTFKDLEKDSYACKESQALSKI